MPPPTDALLVEEVWKRFEAPAGPLDVLRGISFRIRRGESVAISGPSGSGKSTLLHLLGTLDAPSSGSIELAGADPFSLPDAKLARFRNRRVGFVFQDHHLLPQYSALENVLLPTLAFEDGKQKEARATALRLLCRVGLQDRLSHPPSQLSGGERQRTAIARALINSPDLLLCDEPTGNLDTATASEIADLLFELHDNDRNILVIVTHSAQLAARSQRRFELREGVCSEV